MNAPKYLLNALRYAAIPIAAVLLLPALTTLAQGQVEPALAVTAKLGDAAPSLTVAQWVKGEPVKFGVPGTVYVLDFWATWCPPCRESIPHLSRLQTQYKEKNVVIVGISPEDGETVKSFLQEFGGEVSYPVAVDDNETTLRAYMEPFGQRKFPTVFIVKDNRILWFGHFIEDIERTLAKVVSGDYDVAAELRRQELETAAARDVEAYRMAVNAGDPAQAKAVAESIITKYESLPDLMLRLSWNLMRNPEEQYRDPALALRAAKAAFDAEPAEFGVLDTYANALHANGDVKGAVEHLEKAVAAAPNERTKTRVLATLESFKRDLK